MPKSINTLILVGVRAVANWYAGRIVICGCVRSYNARTSVNANSIQANGVSESARAGAVLYSAAEIIMLKPPVKTFTHTFCRHWYLFCVCISNSSDVEYKLNLFAVS